MSRATVKRSSHLLLLAITVAFHAGDVWAGEGVVITPGEAWSGVFGGESADFHFQVKGADRLRLRAGWAFTIGRRTVASGETEIVAAAEGEPTVAIHLDVPPVKEGVVLPALLTLNLSREAGGKSVSMCEKPLRIFPRNPFADRTRWLKGLKITLFDPANTTAESFEKLEIPFETARDVDAVAALEDGTLIIGEGVSLAEQRGLAEAMATLVARGTPVLCLAPKEGAIPIPGAAEARSISFRRADVIVAIDKRLDAEGWPGDGKVVTSGLVLKTEGDRPFGESGPGREGWPWLEVGYAGHKGGLVVCGFGVMSHWDAGPSPRFLLAKMLEIVVGIDDAPARPEPEPVPENE